MEMITRYFKLTYPAAMAENFKDGIRVHAKVQAEELQVEEAILVAEHQGGATTLPRQTTIDAYPEHTTIVAEGLADDEMQRPAKRKRRTKEELKKAADEEYAKYRQTVEAPEETEERVVEFETDDY